MPERYRVEIKRSAAKEIRAISRKRTASASWTGSARWPTTRARPAARSCPVRRRTGSGRVSAGSVYTVADDVLVVEVVKVGNRRDVYR